MIHSLIARPITRCAGHFRAPRVPARLIPVGCALALLCCPAVARASLLTFNNGTQQTLNDASGGLGSHTPATTTSSLLVNVPSSFGDVVDVDVRVRINHPNVRQLRITIEAPDGTIVTLLENGINASGQFILGSDSAGGANLTDTVFDHNTFRSITDAEPPNTGRFYAPLETLINRTPAQTSGTWHLRVTDYRAGDTGTLVSWGATVRSRSTGIQVFTVTNLNDNGAGSLRAAVAQATANAGANRIAFDPGVSSGTIHLTSGPIEIAFGGTAISNFEFPGTRDLTIRSVGNFRVFTVAAGSVHIGDVTIADGTAVGSEGGGAIFNAGDLRLSNCTIRNSRANDDDGTSRGGAVANLGSLLVYNSTFHGNVAENGGAIYSTRDGKLVLSTVAGNSAINSGTGSGGGIFVANGEFDLRECTISGNTADGLGGGITSRPAGTTELLATIVARNTAPAGPDVHGAVAAQYCLIGNNSGATISGSTSRVGTAAAPIDPLLGPLANNGSHTDTMALQFGSPALDAGFCVDGDARPDQRNGRRGSTGIDLLSVGNPHPFGACDIGAFELNPAVFANISTRLQVGTGEDVLIAGFIVTRPSGSVTKNILLRGLGLSLQAAGVTDTLDDPILELNGTGGLLAFNDNWRESQQAEIEATTIPPPHALESAIVRTLQPDPYTAVLRGKDATTGIGLVELYDLNSTAGQAVVANISTRGFVRTGDDVMIGGFILTGPEPARIVIRAIGPSLAASGVARHLEDPFLELFDGQGVKIRENDDWAHTQQAEIQASGLAPAHPKESAVLIDLPAGSYSAVLRGVNDGIGVALVEAYNIR